MAAREEPREPIPRATLILSGIALAVVLVYGLVPFEWKSVVGPRFTLERVTLLHGWTRAALRLLALGAFASALVAPRFLPARGRRLPLGICLVGLPLGCAYTWHRDFSAIVAPWQVHDVVTAPDGREYAFLESSFLQGQRLALARREPPSILWQSFEVIGVTNGDSPRAYLRLVRPRRLASQNDGRLYPSADGRLVVACRSARAWMAVDLDKGTFYGHAGMFREADRPIAEIGPFVLVAASDPISAEDVQALLGPDDRHHLPRAAQLRAAATHPNAEVRDAAARLLRGGAFALEGP